MLQPQRAMIAIMLAPHVARLISLSDRNITLRHGERLFGAGQAVRFLFVVREGTVQMLRRHSGGAALILQRASKDGLVAEASVFSSRYHCEALAEGPTLLARVPKEAVLELQAQDPRWLQDFAAHLASEVQRARGRAELLALKKVGERVDAWLALHGGAMPARGRRVDWASELGVTPEALYRELAKRRA